MIAFGGGRPLHAMDVALTLKIPHIIIPQAAGVFSALGFLMAVPSYEVSRSFPQRLDSLDEAALAQSYQELRRQAELVVGEAAPGANLSCTFFADLRYVGQGHQLRVQTSPFTADSIAKNFTIGR